MGGVIEQCTGCRACEQLCTHRAISMLPDAEGFLTACIDEEKCVNCGLCRERCPQNQLVEKCAPRSVFAIRNRDDKEIMASASGGAFAAAARVVLQQGGVAVGAAYNEDLSVSHIVIERLEDLPRLQSSKYVQSNTESVYQQVRKKLNEGKNVLFSGTPCQVGGLKAYLHKPYDNLYTMDLICHGVPSPQLFARYIEWLGKKMGGRVLSYNFRDKSRGWGLDYMTKTKTKTKTKTNPSTLDPYYYHFLRGTTYRECCYQCRYCTQERVGDITIGDYWGLEHEHPQFYSFRGVSCALVNTAQGEKLWKQIADEFYFLESTFEKASRSNGNLTHPTERKPERDGIYKEFDSISLSELFDQRMKPPFSIKARVKGLIPCPVLLAIKKLK